MRRGILALAVCALVCFGCVSSAYGSLAPVDADDLGLVETESVESLQAAAAALARQADAQAAVEQAQMDERVKAELELLASNPEAIDNQDAATQAFIEHSASAPQDQETEAMTHVFSEDQFHDEEPSLLDTESSVDARVNAEIQQQVAQHTLSALRQEAAEAAELQAYLAEQAGESSSEASDAEADMGDEVLLQASSETDMEDVDPVTAAAHEVSSSLEAAEEYPVMIESASQSRSTGKGVPEAVSNAWHSAVQGASGMMHKLKNHISSAISRDQAHRPFAHSFLASRSQARSEHKAKEGGQWWLEKAPWFLPPPPEWGPMPVTMYTSYFHKPVHPHHLDYAHGIPLPHAEALNLARRTYPQPPFEAQSGGGESFMEVSSESHVEAPLDDAALAEIEALSQAEDQFQFEEEPALIQLSAAAMMHAEADGESESESHVEAAAGVQIDTHPNFVMDPSATAVPKLDNSAVEAVEVDDLTQASPLKDEEILSVPM